MTTEARNKFSILFLFMFAVTVSLAHYKTYQIQPNEHAWSVGRPYRHWWWHANRWRCYQNPIRPIPHHQENVSIQPSVKPTQSNRPKSNGGFSPYRAGYGAFRGRREDSGLFCELRPSAVTLTKCDVGRPLCVDTKTCLLSDTSYTIEVFQRINNDLTKSVQGSSVQGNLVCTVNYGENTNIQKDVKETSS